MKKISMVAMTVFVLILAGCNAANNNNRVDKGEEEPMREEGISLQLLKADEEAGVTVENSEVYQELDRMITEDPTIGLENDFSIFIVDIVDSGTEDAALLFLGINRLNESIKNISFDYTLGLDDGRFVWEDVEVSLSEEDAGIIQANHAVPFSLGITPEQEAMIDALEPDNQVVKIENFAFESAE